MILSIFLSIILVYADMTDGLIYIFPFSLKIIQGKAQTLPLQPPKLPL